MPKVGEYSQGVEINRKGRSTEICRIFDLGPFSDRLGCLAQPLPPCRYDGFSHVGLIFNSPVGKLQDNAVRLSH